MDHTICYTQFYTLAILQHICHRLMLSLVIWPEVITLAASTVLELGEISFILKIPQWSSEPLHRQCK